jgi:hypothetical protein
MTTNRPALVLVWALAIAAQLSAQLSVINSSTLRQGQLPQYQDEGRESIYSDLRISYRTKIRDIRFSSELQLEGFGTGGLDDQYFHILRRNITAAWSTGELTVGNTFQIFGNGLLLRSFELPGFIYENAVYQVQHRVIRDVDGISLRLRLGRVNFQMLSGRPTINPLLPPDLRETEGRLNGVHAIIRLPYNFSLGAGYVDHDSELRTVAAGGNFGWTPDELLTVARQALFVDLNVEYASQLDAPEWRYVDDSPPQALYATANVSWGPLGVSIEYKDYKSFDLGFNDPPPLVRESSERLLNRATHVLLAANERGYQAEGYLSLPLDMVLTANLSWAINEIGYGFNPEYRQHYLGLDWFTATWSGRLFVENGLEDIVLQRDRWTTGIKADRPLPTGLSIGIDLQAQSFRRYLEAFIPGDPPLLDDDVRNHYIALNLQNWHSFSIGVGLEQSDDPEVTDDLIRYPSLTVGWQPSYKFGATLFIGDRRRGTACDHGYCVEVLDYSGTELTLRWQL